MQQHDQRYQYRRAALGQSTLPSAVSKDFYTYEQDFDALAFNDAATGNINIQADSDFVVQKLTYSADIVGTAQTDDSRVIPLIAVQIIDVGSGRNLFASSVAVPSLFGTGQLPFILPTPKLFPARSAITINASNYSASTTYNLRLSFIGYKLFYKGQ